MSKSCGGTSKSDPRKVSRRRRFSWVLMEFWLLRVSVKPKWKNQQCCHIMQSYWKTRSAAYLLSHRSHTFWPSLWRFVEVSAFFGKLGDMTSSCSAAVLVWTNILCTLQGSSRPLLWQSWRCLRAPSWSHFGLMAGKRFSKYFHDSLQWFEPKKGGEWESFQ